MVVISTAILISFKLAVVTKIREGTRASCDGLPHAYTQDAQHLEGSLVKGALAKELLIRDSDLVTDPMKNLILSGMAALEHILPGEKAISVYLFMPMHQCLKTAFSER